MQKRKIKQLLRQSRDIADIPDSSQFDALFQRYEKNLYKTHNVPKLKIYKL